MKAKLCRSLGTAVNVLATLLVHGGAFAQDAFVVGVIADMSGPTASTYVPVAQALKSYVDYANTRGLTTEAPIRVVIADSQSDPTKAGSIARKLIDEDRAILLINASLSSLYAPIIEESRKSRVPLYFAGGVCPKETYPPADPLQFCSTGFAASLDSQAAMQFVRKTAQGPVRLGLAAMAIPIARAELDVAEKIAAGFGFSIVAKEAAAPQTVDYGPVAETLRKVDPNWVYSWSPWSAQVRIGEALRKQGWNGHYMAWAHSEAEDELERLKDDKFHVIGANAFFRDEEPVLSEMRLIARRANLPFSVTRSTEGFITGMVTVEIFRNVPARATPARVLAAMNNLAVDLRGLRGGPLVWTKDNHFRTKQYYRVWRWNDVEKKIVRAQDWISIDIRPQ